VTIVIGAIVGLVGLLWIGQGIGLIGGSAMTGAPVFAVLGAGLVIAAVVVLARARRAADGG
jgi:apolipoprotein N-acyltransferase